MNRAKLIQLAVLKALERSRPYALPLSQILTEINAGIRPVVKDDELAETITRLGTADCIAKLDIGADPLAAADEAMWLITETGSATLARHNPATRRA